ANRRFLHSRRQIAVGDRGRKRLYVPEYEHRARAVMGTRTEYQPRRTARIHYRPAGSDFLMERRFLLESVHLALGFGHLHAQPRKQPRFLRGWQLLADGKGDDHDSVFSNHRGSVVSE